MTIKFVKNVRGERTRVPKELESFTKEIRAVTKNRERERIAEANLGTLLSGSYKKLITEKNSDELLAIANFLSDIGSANARFFYEAYYKLNLNKIGVDEE